MSTFDIIKKSEFDKSFRVASILGKFDIQKEFIQENFKGEIPLKDENWNIGVVYGHSGTGKTTIAKEVWGKYIKNFGYSKKSIVDDMPEDKTIDEIISSFISVGFSSPPSWLKPYSVLSQGEKMRVDLTRGLLENKEILVFDEFTSVVDRNIAKIGSLALQKAIRKQKRKFIAISCHEDILEWLEPDWIFNTNTFNFKKKSSQDQKLNLQFMNVKESCGNYLGSITI